MERLARQQYMKNKDPKACTLLYIVLNRLQVLAGLFKISKDDKDKPLAGFLCRNFQVLSGFTIAHIIWEFDWSLQTLHLSILSVNNHGQLPLLFGNCKKLIKYEYVRLGKP